MTYTPSDGQVPDRVADWLKEELHLSVHRNHRHAKYPSAAPYVLRHWPPESDDEREWDIPWAEERAPTLAEALMVLASRIDIRP